MENSIWRSVPLQGQSSRVQWRSVFWSSYLKPPGCDQSSQLPCLDFPSFPEAFRSWGLQSWLWRGMNVAVPQMCVLKPCPWCVDIWRGGLKGWLHQVGSALCFNGMSSVFSQEKQKEAKCAVISAIRGRREWDQEFKVILYCIESLSLASATWDSFKIK